MFQLTIWSLPSLAAIMIAAYAIRRSRDRRHVPGAPDLLAAAGCVVLWSLGQLLGTLTTDLGLKMLASRIQYPGVTLLPVAWLAFALTYTRRVRFFGPRWMLALGVVPLLTVALAWTNDLHHLVWADARLAHVPGFVGLVLDYGPWFPVMLVYSYVAVILGTLVLAYELSTSPRHRRALGAVVLAPLIVIACNVLHLSGYNPLPFIDPTPLGFALAALVVAHGVLDTGLLERSPGLHRQVIEQLSDPVLVLNGDGRIVDVNPAGAALLAPDGRVLEGHTLAELLPGHPLGSAASAPELTLEAALGQRTYHVLATALTQHGGVGAATALVMRDITERLRAEGELREVKRELERLAYSDPLTALHNRRAFMQRLHEECERSQRHGQALSVLLLDLDKFKSVNDSYGHETGDRVLQRVADLIQCSSRACDVAARLGGEEFALLLPGSDLSGACQLAERLRTAIAAEAVACPPAGDVHVTTSIGVAALDPAQMDPQRLLRHADEALYRAKAEGRDRVCWHDRAGVARAWPDGRRAE